MVGIRLGCTNFPQVRRPVFSGGVPIYRSTIELLEVDANTTGTLGLESQNMSTYGGRFVGKNSTKTGVDLPNIVVPAHWPT